MNGQWYQKSWVTISLHVLFWVLFFVSPYLLHPGSDNMPKRIIANETGFLYLHIVNSLMRLTVFYVNAYYFIPKFFYTRKYGQYSLLILASLAFVYFWDRLLFTLLISGFNYKLWNFFVFNLFPFFFIMLASTAFRVIKDKITEERHTKEKETENLKTELSFLRSQVSPHFMFNVLNNMVALARKKSDELEPSLIKLSSLLRYMLYETDEDKVRLEKEIDYLQSYIDLQRQRFGKNIKISVDYTKPETDYTIEPMLLIPFVENAFKHGSGMISNAEIDTSLQVSGGVLNFCVTNKYNDLVVETKDKTSGIGLTNVQRRLQLLYKDAHKLSIEKKDNWFTVSLQINLH